MSIIDWLGLSAKEQQSLGSTVGKIKDVGDFLADAIEAFEKVDFPEAITAVSPWVEVLGSALSDAIPPVRFLVTVFSKLTEEKRPEVLGYLACTLAYQRSVEQAIEALGAPKKSVKKKSKTVLTELRKDDAALEDLNFKAFAFGSALQHPFVTASDVKLGKTVKAIGYVESDVTKIVSDVHIRFVSNLKTILSHGDTKAKFEPFTALMQLNSVEERAYAALLDHADYQRRQFEEMPVLGKEPFALAHVYAETECGVLPWGDIRESIKGTKTSDAEKDKVDPFSEEHGGRQKLTQAVMDRIRDPQFAEAIVVQGVAGSGKSSFTLSLSAELVRQGLRPIRVRLRDLRLDRHVSEALPQAVRFHDEDDRAAETPQIPPDELFMKGQIFDERVIVSNSRICPWVIILDGWDEVSVSAEDGFKQRVERLLNEVRSEYLSGGRKVHVVLTGRPSTAVTESTFLRNNTPILTIKPLSPEALRTYTEKLTAALETKPLSCSDEDLWSIENPSRFDPVLEKYKEDFEAQSGSMEVLGLPLLTHLAMRLMSAWKGDLTQIVSNSTTLYRKLVDLTCHGARAKETPFDPAGTALYTGDRLRLLLRKTAEAMTVYGQESIPFRELAVRLKTGTEQLLKDVKRANEDSVLTSLMVSYFFKGGHRDLGAEFSHKSFREYLFAEHVVETLKAYGRQQKKSRPQREHYWEDFDDDDPRHRLSRDLGQMLAPQWLSPEVVGHLESLIAWEISRGRSGEMDDLGEPTTPLDVERWAVVRDALADLWDWWGEAVHMRPQPERDNYGDWRFKRGTFADELTEWSTSRVGRDGDTSPIPPRTISIDAHLGDGLCRLTALVHFHIAEQDGWLDAGKDEAGEIDPRQLWSGVCEPSERPRRYQSSITNGEQQWILFAPSGANGDYFQNYIGRIDAAGWRPQGPFPCGVKLAGVDVRMCQISINFSKDHPQQRPNVANWSYSNFSKADLVASFMLGHLFSCIFAIHLIAPMAVFSRATFKNALLNEAELFGSDFDQADLHGAEMADSSLRYASLVGARLDNADLSDAQGLQAEQLKKATLTKSTKLPEELTYLLAEIQEDAAN